MAEIEEQRLANLRNKEKLLAELNLNSRVIKSAKAQTVKREDGLITKKRKIEVPAVPTRSSTRLQQASERPSYKEEPDDESRPGRTKNRSKAPAKVDVVVEEVQLQPAPDVDTIRDNWSKWEAVGPPPTRDEVGTFHFEDYLLFLPNKSPDEMMREGCFGGSYWRPLKSRRLGILIEEDWRELPAAWIQGLEVERYLTDPDYNADVNKYKVACGQSIEEWEASGWIMHEYDVRGWFQWYCRFFQGRRCPDDDRQVSRWRKCVGPTGRWKRMLLKAYLKQGVHDVFDDGEDEDTKEVSPVMHQTCHHWAYEIKQHDLDEAWA
ncbi:hypothetical protein LTS08_000362 [Lithohypha guttulata]|uniref:Vegetatible incompatibility protein HET-E-1 n=1 Tax=Lithohypha guttulata TaxID=1690604 RepID=A0AAN7T5N5_9EURO|nr:hypothetical protein LTR51_006727 [Lithohypha guttulata]KAK5089223.1 hypothetical protein LTR05_003449 [Lithohypha guttulata]KAK5106244.1 hypothetical protein LTS08_000362 [Lithohypha guttulata]